MKRNYRIDGLDCAHCAAKMEKNVSKVKGVKEVSINFLTTKMMLDLEDENLDEIIAGIEAAVKDVDPRVVLKRA
ncbi:MAG: cation transporter [Lachnospiraceae bacterium]|jgi:copper chaperone CopZ|nr:cation transporter [Lachnospiraceae bacterium]MBO5324761.1 cation transporter [Lachnospiraceae bacterium]MBQ3035888.1 cation transporter [Lachnospiraceae bacterium]MBQ7766449.1 cation transporter [Lachnospiraceae bacterium]